MRKLDLVKSDIVDLIKKYNPYHDERGRFSSGDSASFVSTTNEAAVERMKQQYAEKQKDTEADDTPKHWMPGAARGKELFSDPTLAKVYDETLQKITEEVSKEDIEVAEHFGKNIMDVPGHPVAAVIREWLASSSSAGSTVLKLAAARLEGSDCPIRFGNYKEGTQRLVPKDEDPGFSIQEALTGNKNELSTDENISNCKKFTDNDYAVLRAYGQAALNQAYSPGYLSDRLPLYRGIKGPQAKALLDALPSPDKLPRTNEKVEIAEDVLSSYTSRLRIASHFSERENPSGYGAVLSNRFDLKDIIVPVELLFAELTEAEYVVLNKSNRAVTWGNIESSKRPAKEGTKW